MKKLFKILGTLFITQTLSCLVVLNAVTENTEFNTELNDIKSLLLDISAGLDSIDSVPEPQNFSSGIPDPMSEENWQSDVDEVPSYPGISEQHFAFEQSLNEEEVDSKAKRLHIRPFLGLMMTNELKVRPSSLGDWDIEGDTGVSGGLCMGYELKNFFAEFQLSYFQQDLKIQIPGTKTTLSGEVDGVGLHLSGGGLIHFSEFLVGVGGMGIGSIRQEVSLDPIKEKDSLFSAQIFTGLECRPSQDISIGLRYRWLLVKQLNYISDHSMHLAELSAGYLF